MSQHLFLYGTLLPGEAPNEIASIVKRFRRLGSAHVRGRLYDFGEFPGAVLDPSSRSLVHGELVLLPSDGRILEALDQYMKNSIHWIRRKVFSFGRRQRFGWLTEAAVKDGSTFTIDIQAKQSFFAVATILDLKSHKQRMPTVVKSVSGVLLT